MRYLIFSILLLSVTHAFAFGPIPNGTYKGTLTGVNQQGAAVPPQEVVLTFDDNGMTWGDTAKEFRAVGNGFYKVYHYSAKDPATRVLKGLGHGYTTASGLHFKVMLDLGFAVVEGEDSFFYRDGKLSLVSCATGFRCEGEFTRQ